MSVNLHFLDSAGKLGSLRERVMGAYEAALAEISGHISLPALDVCISHHPDGCNPELGIGGGAFNCHQLHIYLDAGNPAVENTATEEMLAVLAHEVHHCVRIAGIPEDKTLGAHLVTEGLACQFETEVTGSTPPSFIPPTVIQDWEAHLEAMRPELDSEDFCFDTWFLGKQKDRVPKYAGFAVGYQLAGRYLEAKGTTGGKAATVPAAEVLEIWKTR
jgi:uncharacterized protein YjaZ